MSKVLIVDDEPHYREELVAVLAPYGYQVETAGNGREAIEVGVGFRPEVLVVDWMLGDHLHGLRVSEVLRTVEPELQTILITGFATQDLETSATNLGVFDFIEKPFEAARFLGAVQAALGARKPPRLGPPVGVVLADDRGTILFANWRAEELFAETRAGRRAGRIADLFGTDQADLGEHSAHHWILGRPPAERPVAWYVRSRGRPGQHDQVFVVFPAEEEPFKRHPVVRLLLNLPEPAPPHWPNEDHVLVLDDCELVRRVLAAEMERAGGLCCAAEDGEVALRLFQKDPRIQVVVLDYDLPGTDTGQLVARLRALRPEATLVGCSGALHREDFAALGVRHYLPKPFTIGDLVNVLSGRLGPCDDCGQPLPLRHPRPDETPGAWECCTCGARYLGVFDKEAPPAARDKVCPAERV